MGYDIGIVIWEYEEVEFEKAYYCLFNKST